MSKSCRDLFCLALLGTLLVSTLMPLCAQADEQKELLFGMSAAFTGTNGEMGIEFYRGVTAYLEYVNARGGVNGRKLRVLPRNDGYNPGPCFENTVQFIRDDNVFALFAYVGTPTTTHILPLLKKYEQQGFYLLFPLSGAQPMRTSPYGKYVFNFRASYFEETAQLVEHILSLGRDRIAVFYQNDAYGRTGWDGVRRALKLHGKGIVGQAAYERGTSFDYCFEKEVGLIMDGKPDAIICISTYAAQAAFIRDLRDSGATLPVAGVSFANSDSMLQLLLKLNKESDRDYTANLISSQVVPSYKDMSLPAVRLYRKIMANYNGLPFSVDAKYTPRRYDYVSFEGFLCGVLLEEVVKRLGDTPSRKDIPAAVRSITNFDLGIGTRIDLGRSQQGMHEVYFTTVRDGYFQPLQDWSRWQK